MWRRAWSALRRAPDPPSMRDVSIFEWSSVALEVALSIPTAVLVSWLFWRKNRWVIGNVVGSGVILLVSLGAFGEQFVNLLRVSGACDEAGLICVMHPSAFIQLAIFILVAFVEIAMLYILGLIAEERTKRRTMWQ
jgi:hypothetical protein